MSIRSILLRPSLPPPLLPCLPTFSLSLFISLNHITSDVLLSFSCLLSSSSQCNCYFPLFLSLSFPLSRRYYVFLSFSLPPFFHSSFTVIFPLWFLSHLLITPASFFIFLFPPYSFPSSTFLFSFVFFLKLSLETLFSLRHAFCSTIVLLESSVFIFTRSEWDLALLAWCKNT